MAFDVFISYPSEDKNVADAACAALEAGGIRCWIAPRDVSPGVDWAAAIVDAIEQCRVMVLIFSGHANRSKQIHREVQRACDAGKIIIPFRIEDSSPEKALGYYLGAIHWLDALTPPLERHLLALCDRLRGLLQTERAADPSDRFAVARKLQAELLQDLQSQIDRLRADIERAQKSGDYMLAGELLYGRIPTLQKQMRQNGGEDRAETERALKILLKTSREIEDATVAIRADPNDAKAFARRAQAFDEKEDYARALADYDEAVRLEPGNASNFFYRHLITRYHIHRPDQALDDLNNAIRLDPSQPLYYECRGALLYKKAEDQLALGDYQQAVLLGAKGDDEFRHKERLRFFRQHAQELLKAGEEDRAIRYCDAGIECDPIDAETFHVRGNCYLKKLQFERAIADFDSAIAKEGARAIFFQARGLAYAGKGDYGRAIADYDAALRLHPKSADALYYRSLAKAALGQSKAADEDLAAARELNPDVANASRGPLG